MYFGDDLAPSCQTVDSLMRKLFGNYPSIFFCTGNRTAAKNDSFWEMASKKRKTIQITKGALKRFPLKA